MATNFVQAGNTISITNAGAADILSGDPVVVGDLVVVSLDTIQAGDTGTAMAEGVFLLPKLAADAVPVGTRVYIADGIIQLAEADAVAAGISWETAAAGSTVIEVKLNG